ncbi:MAG: copper chaperone PCu(A)C [Actinomycetia bacterium]|nr:copper chaperone PCu(A)C [Actinomycetes bacterium]
MARKIGATRSMIVVAVAAGALALAGCSSDTDTAAEETTSAAEAATLAVAEPWAKASEGPMSATFGVVTNDSDSAITIVSADTSASDRTELHETVQSDGVSTMREKDGGFTIAPQESLTLEPGGNHIMIMDIKEPIEVGDDVTVTLNLAQGDPITFTAQAKETAAGEEPYDHGGDSKDGNMDQGNMDSSDESMNMG